MPSPGLFQSLVQGVELALPPDKARQPLRSPRLEALAHRRGPYQLKHLHWLGQSFHGYGAQGVDLHQALHQPQGRSGQADRPRCGQLFHARRQVRGLADRRVVHVEIVTNGSDHHFPGIEADANAQLQPRLRRTSSV